MGTQENTFNSQIDEPFIASSEDQVFAILMVQRRAFNLRWQQNLWMNKIKTVLRYFGLLICLVGFMVLLMPLFNWVDWRFSVWQSVALAGLFFVALWFFIKLPILEEKAQNWTDKSSQKSCRKLAIKCVKQAKRMLPFVAQYEIKGRSISYYRAKNNHDNGELEWQFVWNRSMNAYAIQAKSVTVFFKKASSIIPKIIVLHQEAETFEHILENRGITLVKHEE
ncbi:MAG: hypothetical protein ACSHWU_08860 [Marinicella sp.]